MTIWPGRPIGPGLLSSTRDGPCLRILGPVDLVGASGEPPTRSCRQALEMMAWLLWHPGATAAEMAAGLSIAEGTRRSTLSRLRGWLGADENGRRYVSTGYSGRVWLHSAVTSDWHRLRALVGRDLAHARTGALLAASRLVRGPVLQDAQPGRWAWAEEVRADADGLVTAIDDVLRLRRSMPQLRASASYGEPCWDSRKDS